MSRDDLYERYLSEAERFLKSEASTVQLVKQECDRCDRESTSARNMAGKKKAEIDRLAHQAQEAFFRNCLNDLRGVTRRTSALRFRTW